MTARTVGLLTAAIGVTTLLLTGCTLPAAETPRRTVDPIAALAHVHDLAIDDKERVLVATHDGIYRLPEIGGGSLTGPLGGAHFDAMSFTTAGDTTFASGHPGNDSPAPFQAPNIGIMRTTGAADEWTNTSLGGRADFHALTSSRVDTTVQLYGIDAASGTLLRSQDSGNTWSTGATLDATDLVAYPGKRDTIYAATRTGIALSTDGGRTFTTDTSAPILNQLAIAADGTLYGIGPDGYVWEKRNDWKRGEVLPGTPQAMTVNGNGVILATDRGIFTTEDLGVVWTPLWQPSG
ncbi:hypothetical protein DOE76_10970 [Leifsonia sp. ku-ls]|nr:hypothetical protein DOE76_10970 [Leifsonia sp. ku-ls]